MASRGRKLGTGDPLLNRRKGRPCTSDGKKVDCGDDSGRAQTPRVSAPRPPAPGPSVPTPRAVPDDADEAADGGEEASSGAWPGEPDRDESVPDAQEEARSVWRAMVPRPSYSRATQGAAPTHPQSQALSDGECVPVQAPRQVTTPETNLVATVVFDAVETLRKYQAQDWVLLKKFHLQELAELHEWLAMPWDSGARLEFGVACAILGLDGDRMARVLLERHHELFVYAEVIDDESGAIQPADGVPGAPDGLAGAGAANGSDADVRERAGG